MVNNETIINFLNLSDYDIKKSKNARWIDQKCTGDVISIVADCIVEYVNNNGVDVCFTVKDIWFSEYAKENVMELFSKPDPKKKANNEYNKFFGQPINLLAYSGILELIENETKKSRGNLFKVNNFELLQYISIRATNAINFLVEYIKKVLIDSEIYENFELFFRFQDKENFLQLKNLFRTFTQNNTAIKQNLEPNRIFTKVLNTLAFKYKKLGAKGGFLSKDIIQLADISYNRTNFRDKNVGKSKTQTRKDFNEQNNITKSQNSRLNYEIAKAKKNLKLFNENYNQGFSEIKQNSEDNVLASQVHHIFPQSDFPDIAYFLENLIILTPNQHYLMAHPNNQTKIIDKDFQYICLIAKLGHIMKNLLSQKQTKIYNFNDYKIVLNTGIQTKDFSNIKENDFVSILQKIDLFYSQFIDDNKFKNLISLNYPNIQK